MKTLTNTLMATGLGLLSSFGVVEAGQPYEQTPQGIAAGGCYGSGASDWCGTTNGSGSVNYHPLPSYRRSAYDFGTTDRFTYDNDDDFHTLPFPSNAPNHLSERWDSGCGYVGQNRLPSPSWNDGYGNRYEPRSDSDYREDYDSHYDDQYGNRFNATPQFEPWRPMNASFRLDRRTW